MQTWKDHNSKVCRNNKYLGPKRVVVKRRMMDAENLKEKNDFILKFCLRLVNPIYPKIPEGKQEKSICREGK